MGPIVGMGCPALPMISPALIILSLQSQSWLLQQHERDGKAASRVEEWRGGLGRSLFSPVARPFVCGCPSISAMLRFHSPLIEPDVRNKRLI
jgi:hypothetical protein